MRLGPNARFRHQIPAHARVSCCDDHLVRGQKVCKPALAGSRNTGSHDPFGVLRDLISYCRRLRKSRVRRHATLERVSSLAIWTGGSQLMATSIKLIDTIGAEQISLKHADGGDQGLPKMCAFSVSGHDDE